ncbi:pentapeptide repeat-containing protein [Arsenophonus sp. aPb]|uniref:pentapeptide repeat-containing protein n=1 Tax=Arsenophonus sp. aPb TaxID=3041619 RepID=UPI002468AA53|nr:pentapeptide repeat-containing protein [Arsenophonus sp. aPb]WGL99603.1 pentapeptide repeat-containing protein [Arsenophonus sp. aPb]
MPTIASTLPSSWLPFASEPLPDNKSNIENTTSDKVDLGEPILQSKKISANTSQYEEPAAATESSANISSDQSDNTVDILLMKPSRSINITLPASETAFFYQLAYREQNKLLQLFLAKESDNVNQNSKNRPPPNLVNELIDYLAKYKNDETKIAILVKQLLIPLNEYGAGEGEKIPPKRQQAIIADWLQLAILGMPSDQWLSKQIADNKANPISLLNYADLKKYQFDQLNRKTEFGYLSAEAKNYYQQHVLKRVMPTLMLQFNTPLEHEKLQKMTLDQAQWGYLHAGAMLLIENGAEIDKMSLDDIITTGMLLDSLLQAGKTTAAYSYYFNLPATIHNQLDPENKQDIAQLSEQDRQTLYQQYFHYLHQFSQNNPFIQLSQLLQDWQSRPALARQQLKQHDIAEDCLNNYLYKNREVEYPNNQGEITLLPNIDEIFTQQNQHIADIFMQTDYVLLPQAFNSLSTAEQQFLQQAEINQIKVEYNARDSGIHSLPPGVAGLVANNGLIIPVPEAIDMLSFSFNGEERLYALQKDQKMANYKLTRVDRNRELIFNLIKDHKNTRHNKNFALKIHSPTLLKKAAEQPKIALEKLAALHANKLFKKLHDEGYQKTTHQKVDAFFLSLIPFYTCITEAQKGKVREAIVAGVFDILSFLPFLAKGLQIGGRFSIAMGEAATEGLSIAAKQATIAQAIKHGGKQFVSAGIPHIAKSVPADTYIGLGTSFIRSADPGVELLTLGGLKGINSLKEAAINLSQKNPGLTPLVEALEKQAKNFPQTLPLKPEKIETAYRPELKKTVQVVNIGKQQGKDIFVQLNPTTGMPYGRKYHRDVAGNLTLAPMRLQERLYHLKTQGLGGKGSKMAAQKWRTKQATQNWKTEEQVEIEIERNKSLAAVKWFLKNTSASINLPKANLSYFDLTVYLVDNRKNFSHGNLYGTNFHNTILTNVNLTEANLTKVKMNGANLTKANLNQARMEDADLTSANFTQAKMNSVDLTDANLNNSILEEAQMTGANLTKANLSSATMNSVNLTVANLTNANLTRSMLNEAKMTGAKLTNVDFTEAEMNSVNLTEANLTNATLNKTTMIAANLTKANLANAKLVNANLTSANLTNASLVKANLTNSNLMKANLDQAKMIKANLLTINFTQAEMKMVDLTEATLARCKMTEANLTQANLTNTTVIETLFTKANLSQAIMINVDLTNANLNKAKMIQADLANAKLLLANMNAADLTEANMTGANLFIANLTNANLSKANLAGADLTETNLVGVNLAGANLTGATLNKVNLNNIDLHDVILRELDINQTNFAGAILNDSLTLALPVRWDATDLDIKLNHFNNQGSLLTSIDSIDDHYSELKTKLALQLIHSLDQPNINLSSVALPLLDTFSKAPFNKNQQINQFVDKLITSYLADYALHLLSKLDAHPTIINNFLHYFDRHPYLMISDKLNSGFIQTILAARTQDINTNNVGMAHSLYEKYLALPEIQQQLQYDEIKGIFGDYAGNADWSDKDAQNYLLLSPTKPDRVFVVAENDLSQMLHSNPNTKWNNIFLFQDGRCLSPTEYNLSQCYQQEFPLFSHPFTYSLHSTNVNKLIEILDLGNRLKPLFLDALNSHNYTSKLIDNAAQQELSKIFSPVLDFKKGYSLQQQHYQKIINLFDLALSTNRTKAEHLFALSTVFTRYSSSAIFGTARNSPLMLRYYAYALMEKAHQLDPTLLGHHIFKDWKNRLLGTENTFTCSALLYDSMTTYAKQQCNETLCKIIPPAWR